MVMVCAIDSSCSRCCAACGVECSGVFGVFLVCRGMSLSMMVVSLTPVDISTLTSAMG